MHRFILSCIILLALPAFCTAKVPVIYSTDLYHPHDDPDDHYDLATLFALSELDVKGIIIDMSNIGELRANQPSGKKPGVVAVNQMECLRGAAGVIALGLVQPLKSLDDPALDQPGMAQGGVELILSTLKASREKVCIFTTGSLRDVAAAYNRAPELLRSKVQAVYINAGTGPDRYQEEWNVHLDTLAYRRVLLSDLPIRWYPCFGRDGFQTYYRVDQTEVLDGCAAPLRAFFDYALSQSREAPIAYLSKNCPAPKGPRNMWCTASFIDLAGRKIYKTNKGYEALANPPSADSAPVERYQMVPVKLTENTRLQPPPAHDGEVVARYAGNDQDVIGKTSFAPDGTPDCQVQILGLPAGKRIASAKLTGPRNGIWLSRENPERWLLKTQWIGDQLQLAFTFWAAGSHQLVIEFDDGTTETVRFRVPTPGSPWFVADLDVDRSNILVMRAEEPEYTRAMTSCLTNLLESFPIQNNRVFEGID